MAWLIIALGAALAIAGAISVVSGLPYMRIEWGWTEVIAGTTALSGGIVTIALGAVLFGLASLRRVLESRLASVPSAAADSSLTAARQSDLDISELAAGVPAPKPRDEPAIMMAQDAVPEPERIEAPPPPPLPEAGPMPELRADQGFAEEDAPIPAAVQRRPLLTQLRDSWGGRGKPRPDASAKPAEPMLDAAAAGEPERVPRPDGLRDQDIAATPSEVGRYEAGGATYALFSDGTIEVETETGLHRFASMEELKAFIDQKDQAGAAPDR